MSADPTLNSIDYKEETRFCSEGYEEQFLEECCFSQVIVILLRIREST